MPNPTPHPSRILIIGLSTVVIIGVILGATAAMRPRTENTADTATDKSGTETSKTPASSTKTTAASSPKATEPSTAVSWSYSGEGWKALGSAPSCPTPLGLATPTNIQLATAILYPGQTRGGNYKPHGGFRFDGQSQTGTRNAVGVTLALDSSLLRGSRYIEAGEVQTMLDFVHPCGYLLRYDHLLTLTPELQKLVDAHLPAAKKDASQTTPFPSGLSFSRGTAIATEVGFRATSNVSFDFGVYDLRQANQASRSTTFQKKVGQFTELSYYGTCWLNALPEPDATTAKALPGSGTEGKTSDYCQ